MAISTVQICAAADRVLAAGQNVTLANVRNEIGRGSFTTISAGLKVWLERRATNLPQVDPHVPSPQVLDAATSLAKLAWSSAVKEITESFALERRQIERERDHLRDERDALLRQLSELRCPSCGSKI